MAAETPKRLRLGRATHIKQGRDFLRIRREGQRLSLGCVTANWQQLAGGATSHLGLIVSGKIGNAVIRNRARRLLREAYRLHQHDLARSVDLVLVARNSIVGKSFAAVEKDFLAAMRKAGLLNAEHEPQSAELKTETK